MFAGDRVLAARRRRPPHIAGRWEFPGGRVEAGETEVDAVRRELAEELGVDVEVGGWLADAALPAGRVLRLFAARLVTGTPIPREADPSHDAVSWLTAAQCGTREWLPADRAALASVVAELASREALRDGGVTD